MSQKNRKTTSGETDTAKLSATLHHSTVIRLVIASIIFAASLILKLPGFLGIVLLIAASLLAGYDIVLKAADAVETGSFLDLPVIVIVASFLSFFIGFGIEGAAVILLYQISALLLRYARDHVQKAALELLPEHDGEIVSHLQKAADQEDGSGMSIESVMHASAGTILKFAMAFAVVYAVALPLLTSMSFRISIHRALTMLLIATPFSVIVSIPVAGFVGLCRSARQGAVFEEAGSLEAVTDASAVVFDKDGVFSDQNPRVVAIHSDTMDYDSFLRFVAHALYYSEQPIAKAVAALYDQSYKLELIEDFREIPGCGVALSIDGIKLTFAEENFLRSRGLTLPEEGDRSVGETYYMIVAGRPMGKVIFSSQLNQNLENLVSDIKSAGFERCALLSEDSREAVQDFAEKMGFSELYAECNAGKKFQIVRGIAQKIKGAVLFVYAFGYEQHSDAAVDLRVNKRAKCADAILMPDAVGQLPQLKAISRRIREICIENALFAFIIKAVLIFLSMIGYCNLWLAILIDSATAIITVLNSSRVSVDSVRSNLRYKLGR